MRSFTCFCLLLFATTSIRVQAAPAPKHKDATPAVIDAGCEDHIAGVMESVVIWARVGVRENKKVAGLAIVCRQKDWEAWLKKNLRFERIEGTNRVRVSFRDGNREEQAAIINAVVDYYLTKDVGSRRDSMTVGLKKLRDSFNASRRNRPGKTTAKQVAEAEESFKKKEERIRRLPTLVEHAKAR
jgi:hypothetical protein